MNNNYTMFATCHQSMEQLGFRLFNLLQQRQYNVIYKDGTNLKSYSQLMNECVLESQTEIIIYCTYKIFDIYQEQLERMLSLIDQGFGYVSFQTMRFMGYKKDLLRKIGFWDERFIGGCTEDGDFARRVKHADIAIFESNQVPFFQLPSGWMGRDASQVFYQKYKYIDGKAIKVWPEIYIL